MDGALVDRRTRSRKRLAEDLPAEYPVMPWIPAFAAKQIQFQAFESQDLQQIGEQRIQSGTPSRLCMIGLVVVYCSGTFFAGFRWKATANAASAAS